jgi:two-component system, chemotaxis family, response regulator PixH
MGTALVVDDSMTERAIFSECLMEMGIKVTTASSSEEAIEKIKTTNVDVIVLDIVLPGRSGFELCRELKGSEQFKKIPIVMCSTKQTEMDKFWGMRNGADAYLVKPIDQQEFIKTVKGLLNRSV